MPPQNFGSFSFVIPIPISQVMAFGNPVFGFFGSTSITEPVNNPGFVNVIADVIWRGTHNYYPSLFAQPVSKIYDHEGLYSNSDDG